MATNRTGANTAVRDTEVDICLFCCKCFTVNQEIFQLTPPNKILGTISSAFKISPALQDALDEGSLPQNLCCPSCFCTLFDISRLQKEIKTLEQSVKCLLTELRATLRRSCRSPRNGNSDVDCIRRTLFERLEEIGSRSLNSRQQDSFNRISEFANAVAMSSDGTQTSDSDSTDSNFESSDNFAQMPKRRPLIASSKTKPSDSSGPKRNARKSTKSIARNSKPRRPAMNRRAPTLWFACPHCKKSYVKADFKRETVFQKHHELTCPMKHCLERFRCEVCGKQCSSFRTLERHRISLHTKKYDYYCEKCGAGSVSKGALNRHMLCHTNEKQFVCHVCDKSFKRKMQLKYHIMRHNNELPYMCDHCGKRFMDPQKLKRHTASHVAFKQYPCPFCSKLFATKNYVYNHIYCTHKHRRPPRRAAKQTTEDRLHATDQINVAKEMIGDNRTTTNTTEDND